MAAIGRPIDAGNAFTWSLSVVMPVTAPFANIE